MWTEMEESSNNLKKTQISLKHKTEKMKVI